MAGNIVQSATNQFFQGGWEYRSGGKGNDSNSNGLKETDCSNLVQQAMAGAGYQVGYLDTRKMLDSQGQPTSQSEKYYDAVQAGDVRPGDIVVFRGTDNNGVTVSHTGIVQDWSGATGSYLGAQSTRSGLREGVPIGDSDSNKYWGGQVPVLGFLRPKPSLYDPTKDTTLSPSDSSGNGSSSSGTADDVPYGSQDLEKAILDLTRGWSDKLNRIGQSVSDLLNAARNWIAPRRVDPLALDLDGDGIETIGLNGAASILFDHNGDGIKTATGWVKSDDGLLVLDRNNNGTIDNGNELFGADTVLANGQKATDGFAALRELDTNSDGVFNRLDARYADVQVWRDLNQDGLSEAGELTTLAAAGIASINLNATTATTNLGNGNSQTASAGFTRSNGTTGTVGNLVLAANDFCRQFATPVTLTAQAQGLVDIQGSGAVRDLREAASLSSTVAATAAGINGSLSPAQMRGQVDVLLGQWADTSTMPGGIEQAAARGMKVFYLTPGTTQANIEAFRDLLGGTPTGWTGATRTVADLTDAQRQTYQTLLAQQQGIDRLIGTLERFNAETFISVGTNSVSGGSGTPISMVWDSANGSQVNGRAYVTLSATQVDLLNQSFKALEGAVFQSYAVEAWVKPYVDQIGLTFDANSGFGFDFGGMQAGLDALHQVNAKSSIVVLYKLFLFAEDDSIQAANSDIWKVAA